MTKFLKLYICLQVINSMVTINVKAQNIPVIYLHTDRDAYFPGDTVWFKGYVVHNGKLDSTVKNLYIDWGNKDGLVFESNVHIVINGQAPSQFTIPSAYADSKLNLNAYTKNLALHKELGYFKTIRVLQKSNKNSLLKSLDVNQTINTHTDAANQIRLTEEEDSVSVQFLSMNEEARKGNVESWLNYRKVSTVTASSLRGKHTSFKIGKTGLEAGLLQVLLFDENNKLLSKQSLMIGFNDLVIAPTVELIEKSPNAKNKNSFTVMLPKGEGADLSIAITDAEVPIDSTNTIVNGILFGNHSKNKIENPYSYFKNIETLNRFVSKNNWTTDFNNVEAIPQLADSILFLKGRVMMGNKQRQILNKQLEKVNNRNLKRHKPIRGMSFGFQGAKDKGMQYKEIYADSMGNFALPDFSFADSMQVRLTPVESVAETFAKFGVRYEFSPIPKPEKIFLPEWYQSEVPNDSLSNKKWTSTNQYYTDEQGVIMLREVNINKKRNLKLERMDKYFAKGWFARPGILSEDVQSDTSLTYVVTMWDYIDYLYRKNPILYKKLKNPDVLVNEFSITEPVNMSEVAYVKVFENYPFTKDPIGKKGAIVFYTTGSDSRNMTMGKVANSQTLMGYSDIKTFFSPNYSNYETKISSSFDDRRTLFWSPMLATTSTPVKVEFYNSSVPKGYWVTIQGITNNGRLVFYQKFVASGNR